MADWSKMLAIEEEAAIADNTRRLVNVVARKPPGKGADAYGAYLQCSSLMVKHSTRPEALNFRRGLATCQRKVCRFSIQAP